ncbi:MAG: hypothetical protein M0Q51_07260 [Bacteroidales bacterium]|nr:hypothetical protein [Bacteroidales bacterium]
MATNDISLIDKLTEVIEKKNKLFESDKIYIEYEEYHEQMRRLGISKKQEYNISPVDTIGRRFYYDMQHVK